MSLLRSTGTIGGLTLISRILGFARDMLMARFVGAGFASDAFLVAFRLPNLFRALFAEGAFTSVFVPMFSRQLGKDEGDVSTARRFAEDVMSVLALTLLLLTAVALIAAGPIVWAMTGGYRDATPEKFALTVEFSRITFPYLMLISLASLFGGVLNSVNRFWVNAAAPILLNLCLILGLLFFRGHSNIETARTQSIAVTVSGVLQLIWVAWASKRAGLGLRLRWPRLTPEARELLRVVWPAALGAGAVQLNLLISTLLAARFLPQGSISYLYYADRLNQLPLGLIGIGVGTAMLPMISRQLGAGQESTAVHTQNRAIELVLLLTLPTTVALMVCAEPFVRGLLQHGAFTGADAIASADALAAFSLGLPAYVMIKVLTPGFFARADTKTPVRIALIAMVVNLAGNLTLMWHFRHVGLALSTALSAWVNALLLYETLKRRGHFTADARLRRTTLRLLGATALTAAALVVLDDVVRPMMTGALGYRLLGLTVLVVAGGIVYFGTAMLFRAFTIAEVRRQLKGTRAQGASIS